MDLLLQLLHHMHVVLGRGRLQEVDRLVRVLEEVEAIWIRRRRDVVRLERLVIVADGSVVGGL